MWAGQPLERIPLLVRTSRPAPYAMRELMQDADKQLEAAMDAALATWELVPSTDAAARYAP